MKAEGNWKRKGFQILLYVSLGLVFFFLMIGHVKPKTYENLHVGDEAPERITSPKIVLDQEATERAREKAAREVLPEYTLNNSITENQKKNLDVIFEKVKEINSDTSLRQSDRIKAIKEAIPYQLTDESYRTLATLPVETIFTMQYVTKYIVEEIMKQGVKDSSADLNAARERVNEQLVTVELASSARKVTQELARLSIVPNISFDAEKTQAKKEEARAAVEDIYIYENDVIVNYKEPITSEHLRKMKLVGLMDSNQMEPYLGLALFVVMLLAMVWFYTHQAKSSVVANNLQLLMYFVILALELVLLKIFTLGKSLGYAGVGYLAPVAFGSIMIAMLLGTRLAYFSSILFALISGILFNEDRNQIFEIDFVLVSFIGAVVGAYVVAGAHTRSKILRAGIFVSLTNMAVMAMLFLLNNHGGTWKEILLLFAFGAASGILSGVFTLGFMPFFEAAFGILSPVKLIELSNPNQPLLRKLLLEAPGTYHHSVMVANLSEAACEAVGANGLLARVGSYYHDIGKTKRPSFFIENQMGIDNPHDSITPQLSKSIITAHPYDGVKMLKEYKMPKAIIDIAEQHHGTSLLKYFYHKALKENDQVKEEDFRYPGPKPQFKEVAIVGICDSVEAAVRSMNKPTLEQIEALVRKIIKDKLDDGQLDECDLTLKELDVIYHVIIETLKGTFHSRIEYPTDAEMGVKEA
jgi:hypothetical protein